MVARKIIVKQLTAEMNAFKPKKNKKVKKKKQLLVSTFKLAQQRYNFDLVLSMQIFGLRYITQ